MPVRRVWHGACEVGSVQVARVLTLCLGLLSVGGAPAAHGASAHRFEVVDARIGLVGAFDGTAGNPWQGHGQAGIVQLRQGGVAGVLLPFPARPSQASEAELATRFARVRSSLLGTQAFATRPCERASARLGAWFELDAPSALASDPASVVTWVSRGVRVVSLVRDADSELAASAFPSGGERAQGLTERGRNVAEVAMRAGALVDVAGLSDVALLEVLDLAKAVGAPVITTRGSARAVLRRPGSLSDWQLARIAESGGFVALAFDRELLGSGATLDDVLRQLAHLSKVAGADAIAIGSGFETGNIPADPVRSATRYPRLAEALLAKGWTAERVSELFSLNARRVLCAQSALQPQ